MLDWYSQQIGWIWEEDWDKSFMHAHLTHLTCLSSFQPTLPQKYCCELERTKILFSHSLCYSSLSLAWCLWCSGLLFLSLTSLFRPWYLWVKVAYHLRLWMCLAKTVAGSSGCYWSKKDYLQMFWLFGPSIRRPTSSRSELLQLPFLSQECQHLGSLILCFRLFWLCLRET